MMGYVGVVYCHSELYRIKDFKIIEPNKFHFIIKIFKIHNFC